MITSESPEKRVSSLFTALRLFLAPRPRFGIRLVKRRYFALDVSEFEMPFGCDAHTPACLSLSLSLSLSSLST
jgi:hypothetical protein